MYKLLFTFTYFALLISSNALAKLNNNSNQLQYNSIVKASANTTGTNISLIKSAVFNSKLLPTPEGIGSLNSEFGHSISIDGNRALIGAPGMAYNGAVYVMEYDGLNWNRQAIIQSNDADFGFGSSVSLSGDRALITAFGGLCGTITCKGAAFIFDFDGVQWTQTQQFDTFNILRDFGSTVSLSGDRLLIGSPIHDSPGSVFVYDFDGVQWLLSQRLRGLGAPGDYFGSSVSLSENRLLVGAYKDNNPNGRTGAAYIFDYNGSEWLLTQKIIDKIGAINDGFGIAVSLLGNRALIGASGNNSAFIFEFEDNTWLQKHKLLPSGAPTSYAFGFSLNLSTNRAIVSAAGGIGSTHVFDFDGNTWNSSQTILPLDSTQGDLFGYSIEVYEDNLLIGSPGNDDTGAVYQFTLDNNVWVQQQQITPDESAEFDAFSSSISLFGNRALVGAHLDDENGTDSGSAYIFDFDGSNWILTQKLFANDAQSGDHFAQSVSLYENRAIVGSPNCNDNGTDSGSVYIFDFDGSNWIQTQKLFANDAQSGDHFGQSVSLYEDRALIGSPYNDDNGPETGSIYIFGFDGSEWSQSQKLTANNEDEGDLYGISVSLSDNRALVGATNDFVNGSRSGSVTVIEFNGMHWQQTEKLFPEDGAENDKFGASISLYGDRALIGATSNDSAYVFDFNGVSWMQSQQINASGVFVENQHFGSSVSLFEDVALIGSQSDSINGNRTGSAYLFNFIKSEWLQIQKITDVDGQFEDRFGGKVSLSNDHALIGAINDNDRGTNSGSAYAYELKDDVLFVSSFEGIIGNQ